MNTASSPPKYAPQEQDLIYALDIGTRSIIGILGKVKGDRIEVEAIEKQLHSKRTMLDGQIEDIGQVSATVAEVTRRLEDVYGVKLTHACVAAAGRALQTEEGHSVLELSAPEMITEERIGQLEAAAVAEAEQALQTNHEEGNQRLFLVGYTDTQLLLDHYPMTTLLGHTGKVLEAHVVATFLPSEVIDSLYAVMRKAGLEVASLTLEPIAALNAAIPSDLRLLNLALVDIGAGTSDIAICRDGGVVGYTMTTVAGDEITEALMRQYLLDFRTAEEVKAQLSADDAPIRFTDILGLEQRIPAQEILTAVEGAIQNLAENIAEHVLALNGTAPSALFLAGGGSKLISLREKVATALNMDEKRVAVAGGHFKRSICSSEFSIEDPEYTTPLGIAVSAGLGLISDSYRVMLNDAPAKLFRSGRLTAMEVLMMNGYSYSDLLGRNGKSLVLQVDGVRTVLHGEPSIPAHLHVNGMEAQPSTIINAGDQIDFMPAQPGVDRCITVGQLKEHLGIKDITVNDEWLDDDSLIPSGASVCTTAAQPTDVSAPAAPQPPAQDPDLVSPIQSTQTKQTAQPTAPFVPPIQAVQPTQPESIREASTATQTPQAAQVVAPAPVVQTPQATQPVSSAFTSEIPSPHTFTSFVKQSAQTSGSATHSTIDPEVKVETSAPQPVACSIFLNGKPLDLPPKQGKSPYYLMDLLERSGSDFKKVERTVILKVNGENGAFQQIIHNGDRVEIRYQE